MGIAMLNAFIDFPVMLIIAPGVVSRSINYLVLILSVFSCYSYNYSYKHCNQYCPYYMLRTLHVALLSF